MKVYSKLKQMRGGSSLIPLDSLIESAFDSAKNKEWENYNISIEQPQVTRQSIDQVYEIGTPGQSVDNFSNVQDSRASDISFAISDNVPES